jgi:rod shape-determining protein MreC
MLRPSLKSYVYVGLLIVLMLVFHYVGWLRSVENLFQALVSPYFTTLHSTSIKIDGTYQFFKNPNELLAAYSQCTTKAQTVDELTSKVTLLEKENTDLKTHLNYLSKESYHTILVDVVGRDIAGVQKTLLINAGSEEGIKLGQPVIVGNGILVGKIIKSDAHLAIVRLVNDNQSKVEASILNNDQTIGIVEGGYGISLQMKFVPRNETIIADNQIITSGFEQGIPRGLLIGKVVAVENEAYQGFQNVSLISPIDLTKVLQVSVLLN